MVGANFSWVIGGSKLFQLVTNMMVNKGSIDEPAGEFGLVKYISTNPKNDITADLTTTSIEGSYGYRNEDRRSLLYVFPSFGFALNKIGTHDVKMGLQWYPIWKEEITETQAPIEYSFRRPGGDILYERNTLRNLTGGNDIANQSNVHQYAIFVQDYRKPGRNITLKLGVRFESSKVWSKIAAAR